MLSIKLLVLLMRLATPVVRMIMLWCVFCLLEAVVASSHRLVCSVSLIRHKQVNGRRGQHCQGQMECCFQDGGCAITNWNGVLRAFAQRGTGGNDLWTWVSSDNGASWSGPVTVLTPPSGALSKGIS